MKDSDGIFQFERETLWEEFIQLCYNFSEDTLIPETIFGNVRRSTARSYTLFKN